MRTNPNATVGLKAHYAGIPFLSNSDP